MCKTGIASVSTGPPLLGSGYVILAVPCGERSSNPEGMSTKGRGKNQAQFSFVANIGEYRNLRRSVEAKTMASQPVNCCVDFDTSTVRGKTAIVTGGMSGDTGCTSRGAD